LLHKQLEAVEAKLTLQVPQEAYAWTRSGLNHRHHIIAHVLQDVPEVCAIPIYEDAAVSTHILGVPAAEVRVEESVRHTPQSLHRCLKAETTDVEHDAAFVCSLVHLHGCDLTV
jgi:stress response protein YsnF